MLCFFPIEIDKCMEYVGGFLGLDFFVMIDGVSAGNDDFSRE